MWIILRMVDINLRLLDKKNYKKANPPEADKYRISKEGILSMLQKRLSAAKPPFDILRFAVPNIQSSIPVYSG